MLCSGGWRILPAALYTLGALYPVDRFRVEHLPVAAIPLAGQQPLIRVEPLIGRSETPELVEFSLTW